MFGKFVGHSSFLLPRPRVHATFQNKYLLAQLICARHLMLPSPLLFSFDTSTFPIKPSSPGNLCSREKLAQNPWKQQQGYEKEQSACLLCQEETSSLVKKGMGVLEKPETSCPRTHRCPLVQRGCLEVFFVRPSFYKRGRAPQEKNMRKT